MRDHWSVSVRHTSRTEASDAIRCVVLGLMWLVKRLGMGKQGVWSGPEVSTDRSATFLWRSWVENGKDWRRNTTRLTSDWNECCNSEVRFVFHLSSLTEATPNEAPDELPDETTSQLKHGLFSSKCAQRMTRVIEICRSMNYWILQHELLVVTYFNTQHLSSFSLAVDSELIKAARKQNAYSFASRMRHLIH